MFTLWIGSLLRSCSEVLLLGEKYLVSLSRNGMFDAIDVEWK